jgi:hypothetical protein
VVCLPGKGRSYQQSSLVPGVAVARRWRPGTSRRQAIMFRLCPGWASLGDMLDPGPVRRRYLDCACADAGLCGCLIMSLIYYCYYYHKLMNIVEVEMTFNLIALHEPLLGMLICGPFDMKA